MPSTRDDGNKIFFQVKGVQRAIDYLLEHDNYAYLMFENTGQSHPSYPCQIAEMEETYSRVQNAFGFQKESPIGELFNYHFSQVSEPRFFSIKNIATFISQ